VTIAACYISPEGVVLGADSTSTYGNPGDPHYFNNAQKVFEIGQDSTFGVVTWGLGGLQINSHRTLFAQLGDEIPSISPPDAMAVAMKWCEIFWPHYSNPNGPLAQDMTACRLLASKAPFDPSLPPSPTMRTQQEDFAFRILRSALVSGFCIAGYVLPERIPVAFQIIFDPLSGKPTPVPRTSGYWFWGVPNIVQRLLFACDDQLKLDITNSPHWTGTIDDLNALISPHTLSHPIIPIRDAIDFVHSCILATIKAIKFSSHAQTCGGPIEVAVITTDRKFRWVRHKEWFSAITEGDAADVPNYPANSHRG